MILAYVGGGKGKTTAALGTALRAWGHGMRVLAAFVMKTPFYMGEEVGEYKALRRLGIDVLTLWDLRRPEEVLKEALARANDYDLVILDEVNYAVRQGFIDPKALLSLSRERPHFILTGDFEYPELYQVADLISRVEAVRHYYSKRVGVKGLDW
ncbi:cob(I)yrinic acid a,c-diamide adenosyltransferase [Pyrobaculum islandicum DSM 4184]|uniref:Cob(I)yrinic acid a,c-diamide adenosyltransferase n=1 Tax=Pyrobaculum islandicum (strain DSM 4184 / JCM 9189 / GEO3) TaxID=384616 RepID=A1RUA2_PYRIL|nr:cob(I)yrinic acid a,c-diamide adenosyltransferase [Pyrobaculum islandicum]ABL88534.1 cob(I)yrinic acid a,c-diamide adenosyltransferase [Pyrobaculum islandicum DSM 4184]